MEYYKFVWFIRGLFFFYKKKFYMCGEWEMFLKVLEKGKLFNCMDYFYDESFRLSFVLFYFFIFV